MRKYTTVLGLTAALIAGAASVVTIAPFTPTVDENAQLTGCADTKSTQGALGVADSGALDGVDQDQRNCRKTRAGEGSIASI